MLIPFDFIDEKFNLNIKGILHVEAHECEELDIYEKYVTRDKILWVEGNPDKFNFCKNNFPNILIENAVVLDKKEMVTLNISNNGQSSSVLNFGSHSTSYPQIVYVDSVVTESSRLEDIISKYENIEFNFLNLDIQGVEMRALKGMESYLHNVDYIYTEVNFGEVYENCDLIENLDEYLSQFNFKRVVTCKTDQNWGDAFYIKNL